MKKRIVFVIPSLDAGGGEKSLVNLLNCIDFNQYEVDLILLNKKGLFLNSIPHNVSIIKIEGNYIDFTKGLFESVLCFFIQFKFSLLFNRILYWLKNRIYKNKAKAEQSSWKNLSASISYIHNEYDVAIAFLEKSSIYFTVDKLNATKKIGWIHTNYSSSGMSADFDKNYFDKLNYIVGVSLECEENLKFNFPEFKNKIKTIHNIVSPTVIYLLANEVVLDCNFESLSNAIVTIARLSHEKGCDLVIETGSILKKANVDFKWFIIGEGQERDHLESKIKEYNLENNVILLGLKSNPYPYLKAATLYVQPSRYEGKSIAIDEAKILNKPIVVTNFSTAKDQIQHQLNGIITDMNPDALATAISNLLNDKNLQRSLAENLSQEQLGTEDEIHKIYQLINE